MYSLILHGKRCNNNLRPLLQNLSPFSKPFSSSSTTTDLSLHKGNNFTVSHLVTSLGLTTKLAESISKKVTFENKTNPDSILTLLKTHGFTNSQISNIITEYPQLLILDAEKTISPKIKFLLSREGASRLELTEILSKAPKILGMRWEKAISVYYDFVKEIIEADNGKLCYSSLPVEGSKQGNKLRNVMVLRELGVPQKRLLSLLTTDGNFVCGKERFEEALKKVVELGFDPRTAKFVKALRVVQGLSGERIEEKVRVYERLGFAVGDVWEMFKKWPFSLKFSVVTIEKSVEGFLSLGFSRDEFVMMVKRFPQLICLTGETLRKKTEFLVEEMNWPLKVLVSSPVLLGLSLEKRIVPRCNVVKALVGKGLLGSEVHPMSSVLMSSDQVFLDYYVNKYEEDKQLVLELMAIFSGGQCLIEQ